MRQVGREEDVPDPGYDAGTCQLQDTSRQRREPLRVPPIYGVSRLSHSIADFFANTDTVFLNILNGFCLNPLSERKLSLFRRNPCVCWLEA